MPGDASVLSNGVIATLAPLDYTTKDWSDCARVFQKALELVQRAGVFNELHSPATVAQKLSLGLLPHLQTGVHMCCMDIFNLLITQQLPAGLNRTAPILLQPLLHFFPISKIQARKLLLSIVRSVYERMDKQAFSRLFFSILTSFCSVQIVETDPLSADMLNLVMAWFDDPVCCMPIISSTLELIAFEQASILERTNAFLLLSKYLSRESSSGSTQNISDMASTVEIRSRVAVTASRILLGNTDIALLKALIDVLPRLIQTLDFICKREAYSVEPAASWDFTDPDQCLKIEELCTYYLFFFSCSTQLNTDDAGLRARCYEYLVDGVPDFLLCCYAYNMLIFFCNAETYLSTSAVGQSGIPSPLAEFASIRLTGILDRLVVQLQDTAMASELYLDALTCALPYILTVPPSPALGAALSSLFSMTLNTPAMFYRSLCVTNAHGWPSLKVTFSATSTDDATHSFNLQHISLSFSRVFTDVSFSQRLMLYLPYIPRITGSMQTPLELNSSMVDILGDKVYSMGGSFAIVAIELVVSLLMEGVSLLIGALAGKSQVSTAQSVFLLANKLITSSTEPAMRPMIWTVLTEATHWKNEYSVLTGQYKALLDHLNDIASNNKGLDLDPHLDRADLTPVHLLHLALFLTCRRLLQPDCKDNDRDTLMDVLSTQCCLWNQISSTLLLTREQHNYTMYIYLLLFGLFQDFERFSPLLVSFITAIPHDSHEHLYLLKSALFGSASGDHVVDSCSDDLNTRINDYQQEFLSTYTQFIEQIYIFTDEKAVLHQRVEHHKSAEFCGLLFNMCEKLYGQASSTLREQILITLSALLVSKQLPEFAGKYAVHVIESMARSDCAPLNLMYEIIQRCIELHVIPTSFDTLIYEVIGAISRQDTVDTQSDYYKILSLMVDSYDGSLYLLQAAFRLSETVIHVRTNMPTNEDLTHLSILPSSLIDTNRLVFILHSLTSLSSIFKHRILSNLVTSGEVVGLLSPPLSKRLLNHKVFTHSNSPLDSLVDVLLVLLLEDSVFTSFKHSSTESDSLLPARVAAIRCLECLIEAMLKGSQEHTSLGHYLINMLDKFSFIFWQQTMHVVKRSETLSLLLTDVFICLLNATFSIYMYRCAMGNLSGATTIRTTLFLTSYFKLLASPQKAYILFMQANPRILFATMAVFKQLNVRYQLTVAEAAKFSDKPPTADILSSIIGIPDTPLRQIILEYPHIVGAASFYSTIQASLTTFSEDWARLSKEALSIASARKDGVSADAFLPAPCCLQPLCMLAWFLLYGLLGSHVSDLTLLSYLKLSVRILVFYSYKKTLQIPGISAQAFETQGQCIHQEILTEHSGDPQILYIYPQLLQIALNLCLKSHANSKVIFDHVLKPLLRFNSYHYMLACILISGKEKPQQVYYLLIKPFLETVSDNYTSSSASLSAQSILLTIFSIHPFVHNLQLHTYPELNHVSNRSLRELLVLITELKISDAMELFIVALHSELMGAIAICSAASVYKYIIDLVAKVLLSTQTIGDATNILFASVFKLTSLTFGATFGVPDDLFSSSDSVEQTTTTLKVSDISHLKLSKLLKAIAAIDEYSIFSIGAFMSVDYLLTLSRCFSLIYAMLAHCQAGSATLAGEKIIQSINDVLTDRAVSLIELLFKKLATGTRIKSLANVFDHVALLVLTGASSINALDILQMEPSSAALTKHLAQIEKQADIQQATKLCTAVCHQVLFLIKELNFLRAPRKVSTSTIDFVIQALRLLAYLAATGSSTLILDILAQVVVAPEVLCVLLRGSAFESIAYILSRSGVSPQGTIEKLAKGVTAKKLTIQQCKELGTTVLDPWLIGMIDLLTHKDKEAFIQNSTHTLEEIIRSFTYARIALSPPEGQQIKKTLAKYSVELQGSLQSFLDKLFNSSKSYITDIEAVKSKSEKERSGIALSQINLRITVCNLYSKLFLLYICISYIPVELAVDVHRLMLSLNSVLDFIAKVIDNVNTSNVSSPKTWLPTKESIHQLIEAIFAMLRARFERIYRSVHTLDALPEQKHSFLYNILCEALKQICALLCL